MVDVHELGEDSLDFLRGHAEVISAVPRLDIGATYMRTGAVFIRPSPLPLAERFVSPRTAAGSSAHQLGIG